METLIALLAVTTDMGALGHTSRRDFRPCWHNRGGIKPEPTTEEITAEGLQKCIVWDHGDHLEVKRLIVCPESQGRGVGTAVLRQLQQRRKKIVLYPLADDPSRQTDLELFYRRLGFRPDFFDPETFVWKP